MLEEGIAENETVGAVASEKESVDEAVDIDLSYIDDVSVADNQTNNGIIRTLDGKIAGDELEGDAINYQILLGKIDDLLCKLNLDA